MEPDTAIIWGIGLFLALGTAIPALLHLRRQEHRTDEAEVEALRYGLHEPGTLHPIVDPGRCIGISNCVDVCPEGVLGFRAGQAVAVSAARCIGHGLCERICPMEAIQLVFGTATRGVELPRVRENFETNIEGLYIVGELGGMGLVANAFEQGRQCVEGILAEDGNGPNGLLDLIVVGCGPAGLSASLTAKAHGLQSITLEKEDLGGTVRHYPRKKLVMTRPVKVPGYGKLQLREIPKEELIGLWETIASDVGLEVRTGETVRAVDRLALRHFRVTTDRGTYEGRRVILAIGRRGVPRKLGVPGEASPHVSYSLREPDAYQDDHILIVGGGDSAVEAALALAEQPGNEVSVSYRRETFSRIKPGNHERLEQALDQGLLEVHLGTTPTEIRPDRTLLARASGEQLAVPAEQLFVFIGGELPTAFLRSCGVELETKFGRP